MKPRIVLIGGGGHCASCIDVIEQDNKFEIAGIVDKNKEMESVLGYPLLGGDAELPAIRKICDYSFITVGQIKSAAIRIKLFDEIKQLGFSLPVIISPRAYVSKHATIGEGTIVMHDALVNARSTIGNNCIINSKALIEHDARIGNHCHISTAAVINGGTIIEYGTFVGSNAVTKEYVKTKENDFIKAGSLYKGFKNG